MRGVKPASAALRAKQATAPNSQQRQTKTPPPWHVAWTTGFILCGSYRDRTDDIHGVNVALYQLS